MVKTGPVNLMASNRVMQLPVGEIAANPAQPRQIFEAEGLEELAKSVEHYGVLQPLTVRRTGTGYELVAGERRLRAAKLAGLKEVPCILLQLDSAQSAMVALVENLQRRDLDYMEQAEGIARLMRLYGLSQEQTALRLGKSQSAIANKLRLLRHPQAVRDALRESGLTERHARALLKLPTEHGRLDAISVIARRRMTVAEAEEYIDTILKKRPAAPMQTGKRDVRLFLHSIDHSLRQMQAAGIGADLGRQEDAKEIVLTIRIPKYQQEALSPVLPLPEGRSAGQDCG